MGALIRIRWVNPAHRYEEDVAHTKSDTLIFASPSEFVYGVGQCHPQQYPLSGRIPQQPMMLGVLRLPIDGLAASSMAGQKNASRLLSGQEDADWHQDNSVRDMVKKHILPRTAGDGVGDPSAIGGFFCWHGTFLKDTSVDP